MGTLNTCDLDRCFEKIRFENGEPMFYDFDSEGITEYCFCSKDHQLEWNHAHKHDLTVYNDDGQLNIQHDFFERMFE